ncbi:MAG TPA: iron-sulfur cluster carrier protein ApbC [Marinagarivorans sp.]
MLKYAKEDNAIESQVIASLRQCIYPLFGTDLESLQAVQSIYEQDGCIYIDLELGAHLLSLQPRLEMMLTDHLQAAGFERVTLNVRVTVPEAVRGAPQAATRPRNILLVASGKGGVGKSSTAINLALALRAEGASVGVLDADIYGPSMRTMLGVPDSIKPKLIDEKCVEPVRKYGLQTMSVGYMSPDKTPMIWRGPMAVKALQQLLEQTVWGNLDYLIVDMPPGTGDIHISLAQKLQGAKAIVVTTPQEVALIDARKGVEMFAKVGIPVLGIVENMATHVCSNCGHEEDIFGAEGAKKMATDYGVPLLGSLPLDKTIREHLDQGHPSVARDPASHISQRYLTLAQCTAVALWKANLNAVQAPIIEMSS